MTLKTKEDNKNVFDNFNKLHTMTSFTREADEKNELTFLDSLILRKTDNF